MRNLGISFAAVVVFLVVIEGLASGTLLVRELLFDEAIITSLSVISSALRITGSP